MPERRYMLMVLVKETPHARWWQAVKLTDVGRRLTREQAEAVARVRDDGERRFILPVYEHTEHFAADENPPTLGGLAGGADTIWHMGEPTHWDMDRVLNIVTHEDGVAPTRDEVVLPVEKVVTVAAERIDPGDAHSIETHFDRRVAELDGRREEGPPANYRVPIGPWFGLSGRR